jgi:hypothetical protein
MDGRGVMVQSDVNDEKSAKVIASIPACLLVASNFHEIVRVHVDQYGHIRGLWYQTMSTECPKTKLDMPSGPVQLVCAAGSVCCYLSTVILNKVGRIALGDADRVWCLAGDECKRRHGGQGCQDSVRARSQSRA